MESLHLLADEVRETFAERGHRIESAVDMDKAFSRSKRAQSAMSRELVIDAIAEASSRLGITCRTVTGGAYDIVIISDGVDRRYRVHKANVDPETGSYDILWTSDSIFLDEAEPDALFRVEKWVFGYTVDADGMIVDIFAAQLLGKTDASIPSLILGPPTALGTAATPTPPGHGFQPADEDDLGLDEDDDTGNLGAV
jgi:hypothetical protein